MQWSQDKAVSPQFRSIPAGHTESTFLWQEILCQHRERALWIMLPSHLDAQ